MKRFINACAFSLVLALLISLIGTVPMGVAAALGDVDEDGEITSTDARLALQFAAGKID